MSKVKSNFRCVLCKNDQLLCYKRPAFFSQAFLAVNCDKCKSKFSVRISLIPRAKEVKYEFRCTEDNFTEMHEKAKALAENIDKEFRP